MWNLTSVLPPRFPEAETGLVRVQFMKCGPTNRPLSAPQLVAHTMNAGQIKVVNLYYRLSSSS